MTNGSQAYGRRPLWQWILLYLIIALVVYGLFYYFYLNRGANNNIGVVPTAQPTVTGEPTLTSTSSGEMKVTLATVNNSGQTGTATLKEVNGATTVTLDLKGNPENGPAQPAHIHLGSCPGVGEVRYQLTNVVDGKSVTTISATLAQLKQQEPLAINVHKSAQEVDVYVACGELK